MKNLPIQVKIVIYLFIIGLLYMLFTPFVSVYNTSKKLNYAYDKVVSKQITNYDGYYQAFSDKMINANINKETFIEVTNIIMSNRKDGEGVAWKWVTENQQIPYSEFSYFYKELSLFINSRYGDNMKIEEEKQEIVREHNLLLESFPNNYYNVILKIKFLKYKAGYITSATKEKFNL